MDTFVDQRTSGYNERFTFTGKERDSETGFGYFGARYMDYELMTMWLSVDPMADKYPNISPYAYCIWNPVRLVDPDGRDGRVIIHTKGGKKTITIQTTIYLTSNSFSMRKLKECARFYTDWAKQELKPMTINGVTVQFDVTYSVFDKSTQLKPGDNIMSLNPNRSERSGTPCDSEYDKITGTLMRQTAGSYSNINKNDLGPGKHKGVLHETCHLLGLSDRYYGYNTPFEGFEKDLMGWDPVYSTGLDETHYQNYINYFGNQDTGEVLLDKKIDIEYTNNLKHRADNPVPTFQ